MSGAMVENASPLRVAIVGSGPAGMYAAGHLLESPGGTFVGKGLQKIIKRSVEVDVIERLPTPWGLIRSGVAPDHPDKKRMAAVYEGIARREGFRFIGNIELGRDVSTAELSQWYDAVIYAFGANGERQLGVVGENLQGSSSARKFVGWYNGHPDFAGLDFDLNTERAVLVGNGNVAMDVARILFSEPSKLHATDIASNALEALANSQIKEVVILGRRGPEHAAFNFPELAELGELKDTAIVVEGADLSCITPQGNHEAHIKLEALASLCRTKTQGSRRIVFRFNAAPVAVDGAGKVERIRIADKQNPKQEQVIDTGLLLAAIGYCGQAIDGLPFDNERGLVPSCNARIMDNDRPVKGAYATGWIRRGPKGIIGTNKKCARDCVMALMEDANAGRLPSAGTLSSAEVLAVIQSRVGSVVQYDGWRQIDKKERQAGKLQERPRVKMTTVDSMLKCAQIGI